MRLATIVLTAPVLALLTQPLWAPQWGAGILGEVAALGPLWATIAIAGFFGAVALYCSVLHRIARSLPETAAGPRPRSVWLMFAIPFNFVEDFFIVCELGAALGRARVARASAWRTIGLAWCALQIVSLVPGVAGQSAGVVALAVWVAHWILSAQILRKLRASEIQ